MKCQIPQISWHSRDPVLSIDFQPGNKNLRRIASAGTDSHVLIWYVSYEGNSSIKIECASDLYRHNKSVNVVRFSPNGELLASGDDEGAMFLWQLKEREASEPIKDEENANQEDWYPLKLLRGHLEDIYDISWSSDGNFLVSASMDNSAIMWDMQKFLKVHIFSDYKGYVQGVAWDPLNNFIASLGTDRTLRIHNINTKKTMFRINRAPWCLNTEKGTIKAKLFYDDTLQSYFRRLSFTPDGELLIVPSGIIEKDEKLHNVVYVFSRHAFGKPVLKLPTGEKYTVAVRCNPLLYKLRSTVENGDDKENRPAKSMIDLPYRMVFAVAACDSILLYDTEQLLPFAYVSNIHYTHLTDMTWSSDGKILVASSTDGYCSFVTFTDEELGDVYEPPPPPEVTTVDQMQEDEVKDIPLIVVEKCKVENNEKEVKADKHTSPTDNNKVTKPPTIAKSPAEPPKSVKKPQLTIKNFFASPRNSAINKPKVSLPKDNLKVENIAAISMQDSVDPPIPDDLSHFQIAKASPRVAVPVTTMDVVTVDDNKDEESIQMVFDSSVQKDNPEVKTSPRCKTQLDFSNDVPVKKTDMPENMEVDLGEVVAPTFQEPLHQDAINEPTEADWKLELSPDEDMEVENLEIGKKESTITSKEDQKETPKPKRRIQLITLSKTSSAKSPKDK